MPSVSGIRTGIRTIGIEVEEEAAKWRFLGGRVNKLLKGAMRVEVTRNKEVVFWLPFSVLHPQSFFFEWYRWRDKADISPPIRGFLVSASWVDQLPKEQRDQFSLLVNVSPSLVNEVFTESPYLQPPSWSQNESVVGYIENAPKRFFVALEPLLEPPKPLVASQRVIQLDEE